MMRKADDDDSREAGGWVAVRQVRIGSSLGRNTYMMLNWRYQPDDEKEERRVAQGVEVGNTNLGY